MSNRNLVGQVLGQYELRELLGRGGMAEVYLAYQPNLKRHVAMKVLPPQFSAEEGFIARFIREAEIAASLEHPHIVPIIDFGTQSGINYVVMRLLRGGTLADRVRERRAEGGQLLSLGEISHLTNQISGALDYAHKRNIVHRDIKPNNIMFDTQGTAFLVDFGIAKPLDVAQQVTMPGTSMGTVAYMAPEQWRGDKLTAGVDQYALGLVIYTLVTGLPPFDVPPDAPYALMHKHVNEMPVPPHKIRPELSPEITAAIEKAIAKKPEERYPTVSAFAQEFERAIQGGEGKGQSTGFFTFPLPPKQSIATSVPITPPPVPAGGIQTTDNYGSSSQQFASPAATSAVPAHMLVGYGQPQQAQPGYAPGGQPPAQPPYPGGVTPLSATSDRDKKGNRTPLLIFLGLVIVGLVALAIFLISQLTAGPTDAQKTETVVAAQQTAFQTATQIAGTIQSAATQTRIAIVSLFTATFTSTPTNTPTPTATPTHTPTPTDTVDVPATAKAAIAQTGTKVAEATQAILALTQAFQTAQAQIIIGLSQTATLWTKTPTPTKTPTATFTPSNTPSPTATATFTPSPSPTSLGGGTGVILFISNRGGNQDVYTLNLMTREIKNLTNNKSDNSFATYSPDGQKIAFVTNRDGNPEIYTMNADGSNQVNITKNPAEDSFPDWTPDGKRIVFASARDGGKRHLFIMDANGSNVSQLSNGNFNDFVPDVSPDGTKILFTSDRNGNNDLFVMNLDGSNVRPLLVLPSDEAGARWSKDGKQIVFRSNSTGNYEIYVMSGDSTGMRQLTQTKATNSTPNWSPDGKQIVFWSDRDGNQEIYLINADGTGETNVTKLPGNDLNPNWQPAR